MFPALAVVALLGLAGPVAADAEGQIGALPGDTLAGALATVQATEPTGLADPAVEFAAHTLQEAQDGALPAGLAINVNCPTCATAPLEKSVNQLIGREEATTAAAAASAVGIALGVAAKTGLLARVAAWLAAAAGSSGMGLFSRINKHHALEHPARESLLALASAEPGINLQTCQDRLGVAWGTLVHHVRRLESTGHLVSERAGNHRHLFVAGSIEAARRNAWLAVQGDAPMRLAQSVLANPGSSQHHLSEHSGLSPPLMSKYVKRLADAGLVSVRKARRACHVEATQLLHTLLQTEPRAIAAL